VFEHSKSNHNDGRDNETKHPDGQKSSDESIVSQRLLDVDFEGIFVLQLGLIVVPLVLDALFHLVEAHNVFVQLFLGFDWVQHVYSDVYFHTDYLCVI